MNRRTFLFGGISLGMAVIAGCSAPELEPEEDPTENPDHPEYEAEYHEEDEENPDSVTGEETG